MLLVLAGPGCRRDGLSLSEASATAVQPRPACSLQQQWPGSGRQPGEERPRSNVFRVSVGKLSRHQEVRDKKVEREDVRSCCGCSIVRSAAAARVSFRSMFGPSARVCTNQTKASVLQSRVLEMADTGPVSQHICEFCERKERKMWYYGDLCRLGQILILYSLSLTPFLH